MLEETSGGMTTFWPGIGKENMNPGDFCGRDFVAEEFQNGSLNGEDVGKSEALDFSTGPEDAVALAVHADKSMGGKEGGGFDEEFSAGAAEIEFDGAFLLPPGERDLFSG